MVGEAVIPLGVKSLKSWLDITELLSFLFEIIIDSHCVAKIVQRGFLYASSSLSKWVHVT